MASFDFVLKILNYFDMNEGILSSSLVTFVYLPDQQLTPLTLPATLLSFGGHSQSSLSACAASSWTSSSSASSAYSLLWRSSGLVGAFYFQFACERAQVQTPRFRRGWIKVCKSNIQIQTPLSCARRVSVSFRALTWRPPSPLFITWTSCVLECCCGGNVYNILTAF